MWQYQEAVCMAWRCTWFRLSCCQNANSAVAPVTVSDDVQTATTRIIITSASQLLRTCRRSMLTRKATSNSRMETTLANIQRTSRLFLMAQREGLSRCWLICTVTATSLRKGQQTLDSHCHWSCAGRDYQWLKTAPSASPHLAFGTVCRHANTFSKYTSDLQETFENSPV